MPFRRRCNLSRFNAFVDLYTEHGADFVTLYQCAYDSCDLNHALSLSWYLNLWPGKIDHVFHVESLSEDVETMSNIMGVPLQLQHLNNHEGHPDAELLLNQTQTIQKLHDYLRTDIVRFGYGALPGWI